MGDSRTFGSFRPLRVHLMRGRNGLAGEVLELRDQVDDAFKELETDGYLALRVERTGAPAVSDDSTHGFSRGSRWIKTTVPTVEFVCLSAAVGAADWQATTVGGGGGGVASIFGRSGTVLATAGDYAASLITNDSTVVGTTVKDALTTLSGALGLAPLLVARTIYVNSSTGNDSTGTGAIGAPWQTLARAWADRLFYGELRAKYTINLLGVGPYTMPVLEASACGDGGFLVIQGDPTVDVSIATGSFTGPIVASTMTVPTSAGLGVDTLKAGFLEVTSGASVGCRLSIITNTDASIQVASNFGGGFVVANADTFRVYAPGTAINFPTASSGQPIPGVSNWTGSRSFGVAYLSTAKHFLFNLLLTGAAASIYRSNLGLVGVKSTLTSTFSVLDKSYLWLGGLSNGFVLGVGADSSTGKLMNCGVVSTGTSTLLVGLVSSVFLTAYWVGSMVIGSFSIGDEVLCHGLRCPNQIAITSGRFDCLGIGSLRMDKTSGTGGCFFLQGGAQLKLVGSSPSLFANSSGSCIQVSQHSHVVLDNSGGLLTGGTSDATRAAIVLQQAGGRVLFIGAVTLTGGTPGTDVKTTTLVQNNAFFAAAGDFISDVGGAEVVVRG